MPSWFALKWLDGRAFTTRLRGRPVRTVVLVGVLAAVLLFGMPVASRACNGPLDVRAHLVPLSGQRTEVPVGSGPTVEGDRRGLQGLVAPYAQGVVRRVLEIKSRDAIAYPAHVLVAEGLDLLGCAPSAIALQWVKAGSHARTPAEAERVRAGLTRQVDRVGAAALWAALQGYVESGDAPVVECALRQMTAVPRDFADQGAVGPCHDDTRAD